MTSLIHSPGSQSKKILLSSNKQNILHFASPFSKPNPTCTTNMPTLPFEVGVPPLARLSKVLPACKDSLETTVSLLIKFKQLEHFGYERKGVWHIGIGSQSSLSVDPRGETAVITGQGQPQTAPVTGSLTAFTREYVTQLSKEHDGKIFGQVGFNYGAHVRGQRYTPGRWPILSIMAPEVEITLAPENITIQGYDESLVTEVFDFLKATASSELQVRSPQPVDTSANEDEYSFMVFKAVKEIKRGKYDKVIASRVVDLHRLVDMPATLLHGRRSNTPARTYILNHGGFQATGFSPELVMSCHKGMVVTEPLAGTVSGLGTKDTIQMLRQQLISDPKEIVEHIISVKEAVAELNQFCSPDTVCTKDLMTIKERGSVQHLGSSVLGQLSPTADPWSAFNVLFPSITASGIPKNAALEAIDRLETRPRELYSGAVLLIDTKDDFFEATLCLRIVLQDATNSWIQAGAGIIAQSDPEREFTETCEKMASTAPYVAFEGK